MAIYTPTIGLEIHAELNTASKMFCSCKNDPEETKANVNVCPVCLSHPGTLPVINKNAVEKVLKVGCALKGVLGTRTRFDRKNYFYPDLPKGYQISQFPYPLVSGGTLAGVQITRVHLEEDTARSTHEGAGSGVDFNRAGTPLMELVTEPVIRSAQEAGKFARELQLLLRYLGISDANMEKGQMRVEANISVSDTERFGTKVEVKNLNSFRAAERAIAYEIGRQTRALEAGERVVQETRGWDENKQSTFSQREKESAHDYRYFPEPDLPEMNISEMSIWAEKTLQEGAPELPEQRRVRYLGLGVKVEDADMFVRDRLFGDFFDAVLQHLSGRNELVLLAVNYVASDMAGLLEHGQLTVSWLAEKANAERFAGLVGLIGEGTLSSRGAKEVLMHMLASAEDPAQLAATHNLLQNNDDSAAMVLAQIVIDEQEVAAKEYRAGKAASLQFLIGQGMRKSKGSSNPEKLKLAFEKLLQ